MRQRRGGGQLLIVDTNSLSWYLDVVIPRDLGNGSVRPHEGQKKFEPSDMQRWAKEGAPTWDKDKPWKRKLRDTDYGDIF